MEHLKFASKYEFDIEMHRFSNPCSALAPDYAQVVDLIHPGEAKQRGGVLSAPNLAEN